MSIPTRTPHQKRRAPYARVLYVAAVAALLSACTPSERVVAPDMAVERVGTVAATVESVAADEEIPVIVVSATREMPEIVVTASRVRPESVG
jgi:hypothetical protein